MGFVSCDEFVLPGVTQSPHSVSEDGHEGADMVKISRRGVL